MRSVMRLAVLGITAVFIGAIAEAQVKEEKPARQKAADVWRWDVREDRPRIYLDAGRLEELRAKVKGKSLAEVKALAGTGAEGLALVYLLAGDEASGRAAIAAAMPIADRGGYHLATRLAIVYDWCRPLLTEDEGKRARAWMAGTIRDQLANTRIWRSFHNFCYSHGLAVGMCSIALAHEDPVSEEGLAFLNVKFHDIMKVFEILFPDGEWAEGFDYNRVSTYPAFRLFWALKTSCGVDLMRDSVHMRNTALYTAYGTKADAIVYPGEDNDHGALGDLDREMFLMTVAEWRDPYAQYYVNHCPAALFVPNDSTRWRDLLWYDPSVEEKPLAELPPSRIFRGKGLVMARSGWGWDGPGGARRGDTWVTFKCGQYFGGHCHYDNGHFDVYYKGELAHDSGRYDDDWGLQVDERIRTSEFFNYYQRTIAHNTILVYDPDEKFEMGVLNDGGQLELIMSGGLANSPTDYDAGTFPTERGPGANDWAKNPGRWDVGDMLAYTGTRFFTYACGDATKSYSAHKMTRFVRQLLFIQPDLIVVFDRVVSTKAEFKKTWPLHSVGEPRVSEGVIEIENGDGRLACANVLPEARRYEKIGGPGNEFLVAGVHYAVGPNATSGRKAPLSAGEIPGAWRVELSPAEAAEEDYFLNVMLTTDTASKTLPAVKILSNDAAKVVISVEGGSGGAAEITFAKGDRPAASLKLTSGGKVLFDGATPSSIIVEEGRPY